MQCNKQRIDLIESERRGQTSLNCTPSNINRSNNVVNRDTEEHDKASDIEKYLRATKTSCTSSTDSGVHVSDSDEIPPPSPPTTHLRYLETNTAVSQFHKSNKNSNHDNNVNKFKGNNNENNIFNGDNDVERYDETASVISGNCDNKFKVVDAENGGNCTRYQPKTQNIIESKNVININRQRNLTTTATETETTNNNKTSLQHNEFFNRQQRPVSMSSSLSTSSIANSYNDDNLPPNMHHCSGSPVVSIRSINSTIITSDSDADSDLNSDIEGVHENYVIKKLGTQVTYSPNDPAIPNINSGHTVLNQKIVPNSDQELLSPLATLAAVGDCIGAAQALGPVPSISAVAQRPQIGSIALSNSSDVTFGDKHFYEGPVTIQQFLIDGRDKFKETNGKDNAAFVSENFETSTNNAKDIINSSAEKSSKLHEYILKHKKMIIPGVLALTALLIVATILGSKSLNDNKNGNNSNVVDDQECSDNGTLCLFERDAWRAHPQKGNLDKQILPLHRVVISHTASEPCESLKICAARVRVIQEFHMNSLRWDDIAYNFLISSDGGVYVGRGWDYVGAHTKGYNYDSVGITFIGTYISIAPTEVQLNACLLLLDEGLRLKKLSPDYRLYGARQLGATESPGEMLYRRIKQWPHWSEDIKLT